MSNSDSRNSIEEELDPITNQDCLLCLLQNQDGILNIQKHNIITSSCTKAGVVLFVIPGKLVERLQLLEVLLACILRVDDWSLTAAG